MRVLIADAQSERAKATADACLGRGYVVDRVRHGAAALELALEQVPDVVVCPVDLPVIDGERLAGILRGNPRTREASFVFLVKDELDAPIAMNPRDGTVVEPWHEEDVLDHISTLVERTSSYGEARSDTEIEGKLTQIALIDLLQIFQMNKRTGALRIWRSGRSGSGSILVNRGHILDATVPLPDGSAVVGEKAFYRLLTWREGRFEFAPSSVPESGRIEKPSRALLMESMRQMDEWNSMRNELPAEDARVALAVAADEVPGLDNPLTAEVVEALSAYRRVGEIVDHTTFSDYQVLRVLHDLVRGGQVALTAASEGTEGDPAVRDGLLHATHLRRIREWASTRHSGAGSVIKLIVIGADGAEFGALHEALRECPDFMSEGRLIREPERLGGLCTLGHFALGEDVSLRLVALPSAPAYAPLWEVATDGMLGALVLLCAEDGPALEQVAELAGRLRAGPAPLVHVILCGDGATTLPESARQLLSRIGAESPVLLPAEAGAQRLEALRTAFARLVP